MATAVASSSSVETTSLTDEIRNSNRIFLEKFNAWFSRLKSVVAETQAAFRKDVTDYREQTAQLQRELELYSSKETEMSHLLDQERQQISEFQDRILQTQQKFEELSAKTQDLTRNAALREKANRREAEALEQRRQMCGWQTRKNGPELKCYEDQLKLTITPVKADVLAFSFRCIDPANFDREHKFTVEIVDRAYRVAACEPKLLRMDVLVTQLNETRDFYGFLKGVRREFEAFHGQR